MFVTWKGKPANVDGTFSFLASDAAQIARSMVIVRMAEHAMSMETGESRCKLSTGMNFGIASQLIKSLRLCYSHCPNPYAGNFCEWITEDVSLKSGVFENAQNCVNDLGFPPYGENATFDCRFVY